jgi:hypothetical protein
MGQWSLLQGTPAARVQQQLPIMSAATRLPALVTALQLCLNPQKLVWQGQQLMAMHPHPAAMPQPPAMDGRAVDQML